MPFVKLRLESGDGLVDIKRLLLREIKIDKKWRKIGKHAKILRRPFFSIGIQWANDDNDDDKNRFTLPAF